MATSIELSKITKVELRDCWENEATDFTPWLAKDENIAMLADALGMNELEVRAQEEHVGPFRADILCVDPGTDKFVLIENQLEITDHKHLGQILTYAAAPMFNVVAKPNDGIKNIQRSLSASLNQ